MFDNAQFLKALSLERLYITVILPQILGQMRHGVPKPPQTLKSLSHYAKDMNVQLIINFNITNQNKQ